LIDGGKSLSKGRELGRGDLHVAFYIVQRGLDPTNTARKNTTNET
jgi:hypothetical protein